MQTNDIIAIAVTVGLLILLAVSLWQHRSKAINWLIWAVSAAEMELGSKTGELKLHRVYDWYIKQFPFLAKIIPFCLFARWVDIALKTMREWVKNKTPIGAYIESKKESPDEDSR